MPSEFEDEVIFETELLLNQLYAEAVNQDLPIDIQEIILETLSKSSFLSHGIKYRSERNVDFFKTAKVLGRTIRFIAESIERM
jgi:hypothetical protein